MIKMHFLASFVTTLAVLAFAAAPVSAADNGSQTAEQSQTLKVECHSGAYGQDSNCKAEGTQTQKLHQVIAYTKVLGTSKIHIPVNTAADTSVMLAVLATGLTGIGAFIGYTRLQ